MPRALWQPPRPATAFCVRVPGRCGPEIGTEVPTGSTPKTSKKKGVQGM